MRPLCGTWGQGGGDFIPIMPLSEIQDRCHGEDDGWEQISLRLERNRSSQKFS